MARKRQRKRLQQEQEQRQRELQGRDNQRKEQPAPEDVQATCGGRLSPAQSVVAPLRKRQATEGLEDNAPSKKEQLFGYDTEALGWVYTELPEMAWRAAFRSALRAWHKQLGMPCPDDPLEAFFGMRNPDTADATTEHTTGTADAAAECTGTAVPGAQQDGAAHHGLASTAATAQQGPKAQTADSRAAPGVTAGFTCRTCSSAFDSKVLLLLHVVMPRHVLCCNTVHMVMHASTLLGKRHRPKKAKQEQKQQEHIRRLLPDETSKLLNQNRDAPRCDMCSQGFPNWAAALDHERSADHGGSLGRLYDIMLSAALCEDDRVFLQRNEYQLQQIITAACMLHDLYEQTGMPTDMFLHTEESRSGRLDARVSLAWYILALQADAIQLLLEDVARLKGPAAARWLQALCSMVPHNYGEWCSALFRAAGWSETVEDTIPDLLDHIREQVPPALQIMRRYPASTTIAMTHAQLGPIPLPPDGMGPCLCTTLDERTLRLRITSPHLAWKMFDCMKLKFGFRLEETDTIGIDPDASVSEDEWCNDYDGVTRLSDEDVDESEEEEWLEYNCYGDEIYRTRTRTRHYYHPDEVADAHGHRSNRRRINPVQKALRKQQALKKKKSSAKQPASDRQAELVGQEGSKAVEQPQKVGADMKNGVDMEIDKANCLAAASPVTAKEKGAQHGPGAAKGKGAPYDLMAAKWKEMQLARSAAKAKGAQHGPGEAKGQGAQHGPSAGKGKGGHPSPGAAKGKGAQHGLQHMVPSPPPPPPPRHKQQVATAPGVAQKLATAPQLPASSQQPHMAATRPAGIPASHAGEVHREAAPQHHMAAMGPADVHGQHVWAAQQRALQQPHMAGMQVQHPLTMMQPAAQQMIGMQAQQMAAMQQQAAMMPYQQHAAYAQQQQMAMLQMQQMQQTQQIQQLQQMQQMQRMQQMQQMQAMQQMQPVWQSQSHNRPPGSWPQGPQQGPGPARLPPGPPGLPHQSATNPWQPQQR